MTELCDGITSLHGIHVFDFQEHGFSPWHIVPHGSYLMNCGSPKEDVLQKSRDMLADELKRCEAMGLTLFNFHPGMNVPEHVTNEIILDFLFSQTNQITNIVGYLSVHPVKTDFLTNIDGKVWLKLKSLDFLCNFFFQIPGSTCGEIPRGESIQKIADSINMALDKTNYVTAGILDFLIMRNS